MALVVHEKKICSEFLECHAYLGNFEETSVDDFCILWIKIFFGVTANSKIKALHWKIQTLLNFE